jgi:hypothetical protein
MFQRFQRRDRGAGAGEIEPDIRLGGGGNRVRRRLHAEVRDTGQLADIGVQMRRSGDLGAARNRQPVAVGDGGQLAAHAAGDACNGDGEGFGSLVCHGALIAAFQPRETGMRI